MADSEKSTEGGNGRPESDVDGGKVISIAPEQRGRGRPPGSKNQPKPAVGAKTGKPDETLDPAVIGDLFVSLAEIGDDLFVLAILARAKSKLSPEIFPKFGEEMSRIRLQEKDKNLIRTGAIALAKKYTFLLVWGPELILLICFVQYSARMGNTFRKINALPDYASPGKPVKQSAESANS